MVAMTLPVVVSVIVDPAAPAAPLFDPFVEMVQELTKMAVSPAFHDFAAVVVMVASTGGPALENVIVSPAEPANAAPPISAICPTP